MEKQIVKTKEIVWNGKTYTIELTKEQYEELCNQADICKLNGWSYDDFIHMISHWTANDWPEMCQQAFKDSKPELKVGMGATMNLWSDRRAMTITKIISDKEIEVTHNETKCIDYYAGDYEILDKLQDGRTDIFTLRKNGTWVEKGQPKKDGSVTLTVGYRRHYIDPTF